MFVVPPDSTVHITFSAIDIDAAILDAEPGNIGRNVVFRAFVRPNQQLVLIDQHGPHEKKARQ
jgi:hypothetical protein